MDDDVGMTETIVEVDGRRLRREQNRAAVLDALVKLFGEGTYEPSSAQIAERAGLSPRSLFRYFEDVDDLSQAAIECQQQAARPLLDLPVDPSASTGAKARAVAERRVDLFEAIAPGARAARVCAHRHPVVAQQLREARGFLRRQLRQVFEPELADERAVLLAAVDALCSFETYELMRADQGLSRAKTIAALAAALEALLASGGH